MRNQDELLFELHFEISQLTAYLNAQLTALDPGFEQEQPGFHCERDTLRSQRKTISNWKYWLDRSVPPY